MANYADLVTYLTASLLFEEKMEVSLSIAQREGWHGALLYIELSFGAGAKAPTSVEGERFFEQLAVRLKEETRSGDLILKTEKGDFLLWLQHVDAEKALQIGKRIHTSLEHLIEPLGQVRSSIGIALYPYDGKTREQLEQRAFYAVHQGRVRGHAVHIYDPIAQSPAELELGISDEPIDTSRG
jgi:GGDEF domain-containing protein